MMRVTGICNMKKILAGFVSIVICISLLSTISFSADADVTVAVDFSGEKTEISEYIYGVNDWADTEDATCLRQGGNRYTGYNWENNYSNAGRDWHHYSDTYQLLRLYKDVRLTVLREPLQ